jgi:AcrR family transcriptional regulator
MLKPPHVAPADNADSCSRPRWERRKVSRPHELLCAALSLFIERGYAATRLDDVAARAGVSKGTLYLYFENKQELFKAVVREGIVPTIDEGEQLIDEYTGHSADLFREFMIGWWRNIGESNLAGINKLVMAEAGNFPEMAAFYFEEVIVRRNALIERLLERGIARGEFRVVDVASMRTVLVAPILMLMGWRHAFGACSGETIDPKKYLDSFIDFALHGLLARDASTVERAGERCASPPISPVSGGCR